MKYLGSQGNDWIYWIGIKLKLSCLGLCRLIQKLWGTIHLQFNQWALFLSGYFEVLYKIGEGSLNSWCLTVFFFFYQCGTNKICRTRSLWAGFGPAWLRPFCIWHSGRVTHAKGNPWSLIFFQKSEKLKISSKKHKIFQEGSENFHEEILKN